jgi:hypothetical protein
MGDHGIGLRSADMKSIPTSSWPTTTGRPLIAGRNRQTPRRTLAKQCHALKNVLHCFSGARLGLGIASRLDMD